MTAATMQWPYRFPVDLSDEDLALRREALTFYGQIAHVSSLTPLLIAILFRLIRIAITSISSILSSSSSSKDSRTRHVSYHRVPGHADAPAKTPSWSHRKLSWWLTDHISLCGTNLGRRDEWILGLTWTAWLLTLTFWNAPPDYIHLTKRFASIAISQLPLHYLLSLRTLNPFTWALSSSHERINRYHRLLGLILYAFFLAHLLLFNNYLHQVASWSDSLSFSSSPITVLGHALSLCFHSLAGTSLARVRRFSYRVFFITHVGVAFAAPILVFFHARYARVYVVEALAALTIDIAARKFFSTIIATPSALELIPDTNLIKISLPLPAHKATAYRSPPSSHIYLSIPSSRNPLFQLLFNPFTVASVTEHSLSLIARRRSGPMTSALADLAKTAPTPRDHRRSKLRLAIEGPYGAMPKHYHELLDFSPSHILLITGGVGATFTIPLYNALLSDLPLATFHFVWAVRALEDAAWAFPEPSPPESDDSSSDSSSSSSSPGPGPEFLAPADENIHLYITINEAEVNDSNTLHPRSPSQRHRKRPHTQAIVDDTFRQRPQDRIAIVVCGPTEMARDVTHHVRPWVMKGRDIWFHQESFGW